MATALIWLFLALISTALALQPAQNDLCFAADIRVALANDAFYFMGGLYTQAGATTDAVMNSIFAIPLNQSFSTTGLLASTDYLIADAKGAAYYNQGAFFTDVNSTNLYSFAGFKDPSGSTNTVLAYDVETGAWSNPNVDGGSYNFGSRAAAITATTEYTDLGLSFFSGSWLDIPGMVRFDASDRENLKWTNETDNNPPLTLDGSMEFVRYGKSGSLITFGGYNKDYKDTTLTGWSYDSRSMATIGVYDIDSATWYNVTAEGDIPSNRSAFCTGVSYSPDDSSVQITMYGGWDLWSGHSMADIYVLSIPSFQWMDVTDNSNVENSLNSSAKVGRDSHKCKTVNDRTMLSVGGYVRFDSEWVNSETCDSSYPVVRALDASTHKWLDEFSPNAEDYYVPDVVVARIGGNSKGGATMTAPAAGFTDTSLNDLFAQTVQKYPAATSATSGGAQVTATQGASSSTVTSSGSTSSSTSSVSPSAEHQSSASSSHVGAIAGGVVGGIVGLAIIGGLFFLRRRKSGFPSPDTAPQGYLAPHARFYGRGEKGSELPSREDIAYNKTDPYNRVDQGAHRSGIGIRQHQQLAEVDGGYQGAEADSWTRQQPGRNNASELPG